MFPWMEGMGAPYVALTTKKYSAGTNTCAGIIVS